jgi:hypothetical protein
MRVILTTAISLSGIFNVNGYYVQPSPQNIRQQQQQQPCLLFATTTADVESQTVVFQDVVDDGNDDDDASAEFPPPLSQIDRLKRAATFWSSALPIVANYYGLIGNIKLKQLMDQDALTEDEVEVRHWIGCTSIYSIGRLSQHNSPHLTSSQLLLYRTCGMPNTSRGHRRCTKQ